MEIKVYYQEITPDHKVAWEMAFYNTGATLEGRCVLRCPDGQTGSGHLLATAFMDTLMLLATLCADDAVRIIFFPLASRCTLLSG